MRTTRKIAALVAMLGVACGSSPDGAAEEAPAQGDIAASESTRRDLGVERWSVDDDAAATTIEGHDPSGRVVVRFQAHESMAADGKHTAIALEQSSHHLMVETVTSLDGRDLLSLKAATRDGRPIDAEGNLRAANLLKHDLESAGTSRNGTVRPASVLFAGALATLDLVDPTKCELYDQDLAGRRISHLDTISCLSSSISEHPLDFVQTRWEWLIGSDHDSDQQRAYDKCKEEKCRLVK